METADCELGRANTKETRPLLTMKNKRAATTRPGINAPALRSEVSTPNARTTLTTRVEMLNNTCTGVGLLRVRQKHCTRVARTPTTKDSVRVICAIAISASTKLIEKVPCIRGSFILKVDPSSARTKHVTKRAGSGNWKSKASAATRSPIPITIHGNISNFAFDRYWNRTPGGR